ncbi:hypothetical protein [Pantoea sp. ACRSB]|uniref:hypothetical protein n=1 Tax=Pantoea sp. ACRSB TaxID=2918207 RepID=UPI002892C13E|nr:hypothetical protein [Pantoea sp. ACRSB]MCG7389678.1 hypothetical protein [Pantoea sp. ACRSB]
MTAAAKLAAVRRDFQLAQIDHARESIGHDRNFYSINSFGEFSQAKTQLSQMPIIKKVFNLKSSPFKFFVSDVLLPANIDATFILIK